MRPWRIVIGDPMIPPAGAEVGDQLAAAEFSEAVRDAVSALLAESHAR
jgi:hypothetical protein